MSWLPVFSLVLICSKVEKLKQFEFLKFWCRILHSHSFVSFSEQPQSTAITGMRLAHLVNSREDAKSFFVHKVLGISCLVSFAYRFSNVGAQDMSFNTNSPLILATILLHASLSVSSLIFEIPRRRIDHGARIWPEYRWHSIFFALRSLAGMLVLYVFGGKPMTIFKECLYTGIVLATSACADYVTKCAGEHSSSTIRDLDTSAGTKFFYSVMQFHATAVVIYGMERYSLNFAIVWVVQLTAFLLTLQRKNLIPQSAVLVAYGIILVFTFVVGFYEGILDGLWILGITAALSSCLRMGLGMNKYVVWIAMAILIHFLRPIAYREDLLAAPMCVTQLLLGWVAYRKINSSSTDSGRRERTPRSNNSDSSLAAALMKKMNIVPRRY